MSLILAAVIRQAHLGLPDSQGDGRGSSLSFTRLGESAQVDGRLGLTRERLESASVLLKTITGHVTLRVSIGTERRQLGTFRRETDLCSWSFSLCQVVLACA